MQVEDGGGQRHVEGAGRLVAQQHLGGHDRGPGQGHPLALAARELQRPWPRPPRRAGRPRSRASRTRCAPLRPGHRLATEPLPDQLADREPRRERGARVLEHHLRPGAARRTRSLPASIGSTGRRWRAAASTSRTRSRPPGRPPRPLSTLEVDAAQGVQALPVRKPVPMAKRLLDLGTRTAGGGPPSDRSRSTGPPAGLDHRRSSARLAPRR